MTLPLSDLCAASLRPARCSATAHLFDNQSMTSRPPVGATGIDGEVGGVAVGRYAGEDGYASPRFSRMFWKSWSSSNRPLVFMT